MHRALAVPTVLVNVSVVGAMWSLLTLFVHQRTHPFVQLVDAAFLAVNVPAGPGVLDAVVLMILAMAASRRKRLALWAFVVVQVLGGLASVLTLTDPQGVAPPRLAVCGVSVVVALVCLALSWRARPAFPGRIVPGSLVGSLAILIGGLGVNALVGILLTSVGPLRHRYEGSAEWVLARVLGRVAAVFVTDQTSLHGPRGLGLFLSFCSAVVTVAALVFFLRGQRTSGRTPADDLFVRGLLLRWGQDSLGYFATRDDRSVVASTDRRAAISHGVAAGVSLAGGDPLGDPQSWDNAITQWRAECARFGWIPAALSVSEQGARAFRNQGFIVKAMGDEAVIHTNAFDLNAPQMRPLAQAVRRARREGVDISIRQLRDIDEDERLELAEAARTYRRGDERGFSMSLERILEPVDGRTTVVVARGADGGVQALLTFVPWGARGVSLTLMRRSPTSVNGIVEAMVVALVEHGRDGAIDRVSLNFAMFRKVLDEGVAVDATLNARLARRVMLLASRKWQLDSLYESNARYQPEWVPRYLCFLSYAEATPVVIASGVLEGFLPRWGPRLPDRPELTEDHLRRVRALEDEAARALPERTVSEQSRVRRDKAARLAAAGMEPWPPSVALGEEPASLLREGADLAPGTDTGRRVVTGGRVRAVRDHGRIVFADVQRRGVRLQVVLDASRVGAEQMGLWRLTDIGDVVAVEGTLGRTRRGEVSVLADRWRMAAKSLRPLPAPGTGLDPRTRSRQRVVHFLTDPTAVDLLRRRSKVLAEVRAVLGEQGFVEVETPMLQPVKGGANARPFVTHLNAYGTDVFLRIAPELYLKRLAVAGMGAVFEMGRSFRNEGADATHNPEFTSVEAYRAGGDYTTMRRLAQDLIQRAAVAVNGSCTCLRPAGSPGTGSAPVAARLDGVDLASVDLSGDWPVVTVHDAVSRAAGREVTPDTPAEELHRMCVDVGAPIPAVADGGALLGALYETLVESRTVAPTFYTDFPASTSPLTRRHRRDPRLAERWDLVAFGVELGTAYTELTDPLDQRERFTEQSLAAAAGDPEAMSIDDAFLDDLELGLPPTGGLGIGVDRMVMLLTGMSIRQVLAFPYVRPLLGRGGVR